EERDGVAALIGHCQVELAVAVEVGGDQARGRSADGNTYCDLEGAVAVAGQEADVVTALVGGGRDRLAAAVEVAHDYRCRRQTDQGAGPSWKSGSSHKAWQRTVFQQFQIKPSTKPGKRS